MFSTRILYIIIVLTLSGSLSAALAQDSNEPDEFNPSGRFFGYFFGDIYYKAHGGAPSWGTSEFAGDPEDEFGGRLRRLYLGYDHQFSPELSSRILLESTSDHVDIFDEYEIFFKEVNITWSLEMGGLYGSTIKAGLIPSPIFSIPNREWGYRSLEKESTHVRGFGSSVDQGISFTGNFDPEERHGFRVMAARGAGRHLESDSHFETVGSLWFQPLPDLTLELMGQYQQLSDNRTRTALRGLISLQKEWAMAGLSVARGWWSNQPVGGGILDRQPLVASFFTAFTPFPEVPVLRFVGRIDYHDSHRDYSRQHPFTDPSLDYNESLIIAGFHFAVTEKLDLMPNVHINNYHHRHSGIPERESDVVPRLTIFARF